MSSQKNLMPRSKKTLGKGAKVSVLYQYLHPAKYLSENVINPSNDLRINGLIVDWLEEIKVSHKKQLCIVFHHDSYKNNDGSYVKRHCVKRWASSIEEEGPLDYFFTEREDNAEVQMEQQLVQADLPPTMLEAGI